jgi:hypothetical protein
VLENFFGMPPCSPSEYDNESAWNTMSIRLWEALVCPITAEIVPLGWTHWASEDFELIERDVSCYVATASLEGFGLQEMLQDVLDKYRNFFMPYGDVEAIERDGEKIVVFYLRARKGY